MKVFLLLLFVLLNSCTDDKSLLLFLDLEKSGEMSLSYKNFDPNDGYKTSVRKIGESSERLVLERNDSTVFEAVKSLENQEIKVTAHVDLVVTFDGTRIHLGPGRDFQFNLE